MSSRSLSLLFTILSGLLLLSAGCASHPRGDLATSPPGEALRRLSEDIRDESLTWNASHAALKDRPWLGVDSEIRLRLEQMQDLVSSPEAFRQQAAEVTEAMLEQGRSSLEVGAMGLGSMQDVGGAVASVARAERDAVSQLASAVDCREWLARRLDALPNMDKRDGMTWRMLATLPAVPFVKAWISRHAAEEWRGPNWRDFAKARIFEPDTSADLDIAGHLETASESELLSFYAPRIVQEIPDEGPPDFRDDLIGRAGLIPDRHGDPVAEIDVTRPTVYGHVTRAYLNGAWRTQLNYSFWYHDHPSLKPRDPEAGRAEGQLVRITLDSGNRPMVSEAVYACGCYHRIYPLDDLERAAEREFGPPVQGDYSLAADVDGRIDPIVPECGGAFRLDDPHPLVYVRSGFHLIAAVRFERLSVPRTESVSYELLPSRALDTLPWGTETASFFRRDGLVRGADRPEALLMFPSGIYHAGTPRADGLHLIHFDQYDYNDPTLLQTMLRLPATTGGLGE